MTKKDVRIGVRAGIAVAIVYWLWVFVVAPSHVRAQILNPLASVPAYTLADPITTERLTVATLDGRFAVTPMQGCDWLAPYQQVNMYPNWAVPPWLGLSGTDATQPGCVVRVEGRMDATPCFTNDAGLCDVALETN
jgi:hypothetical protein